MGLKNQLPRIAEALDEQVDELIPRLLEAHGTPFKVAVELGVYPNTILNWLKKNGYRYMNGEWVYVGEKESA